MDKQYLVIFEEADQTYVEIKTAKELDQTKENGFSGWEYADIYELSIVDGRVFIPALNK